jgi:hypothetical protein
VSLSIREELVDGLQEINKKGRTASLIIMNPKYQEELNEKAAKYTLFLDGDKLFSGKGLVTEFCGVPIRVDSRVKSFEIEMV